MRFLITYLEVIFKFLYFHSNFLYEKTNKILKLIKKSDHHEVNYCFQEFKESIIKRFSDGDTIIVHSSNDFFKKYNIKPDCLIDFLLDVVGVNGNLIIPTIPLFKSSISFKNSLFLKEFPNNTFYDPLRTRPWTGILSFTTMSYPGFIRSINPLNTMSVIGKNKYDLVRNDLFSDDSLACDEFSVLGLSLKYNSKILFLDVDPIHSMTMIHCNEDIKNNNWPIKNWYWKRVFNVRINDEIQTFTLRERRPFWAIFFSQKRLSIDLKREGILKFDISSNFAYCCSKKLINFLGEKKHTGYPYFVPFWMKK